MLRQHWIIEIIVHKVNLLKLIKNKKTDKLSDHFADSVTDPSISVQKLFNKICKDFF